VTENTISRWQRRRALISRPPYPFLLAPLLQPATVQARECAVPRLGSSGGRHGSCAGSGGGCHLHIYICSCLSTASGAWAVACGFPSWAANESQGTWFGKASRGGGELWSELGHYIRIQSSSYIRIWRRLGLAGRGPMFWRPLLSLFRLRSTPFWGSNKHLFSFSSLPVFSVVQCTETHDTRRARLPQLLSARVWASFLFRGLLSTSPSHPIISPNGDAERCGDAVLVAMVAVTAVARTVGRHAGAGAYISKHSTLRRYVSMPGAVAIVGEAPSI